MKKTWVSGMMLLAIVMLLAACSSNSNNSEDTKQNQQTAYTAAKRAEDKVFMLFSKTALDDGTTVLDALTGTREKAQGLLENYFDAAMTTKILDHYLTGDKNGDQIVTNKDSFFPASILATKSVEEVKIEADGNTYTITTPDNGVFTLEWNKDRDRYLVTNYEKK